MSKRKLKKSVIALVIILLALAVYFIIKGVDSPAVVTTKVIGNANYLCVDQKRIDATYYESDQSTASSGEAIINGRVELSLSDGRSVTLAQVSADSGLKYTDANESIIFWNRGAWVIFTENGEETYRGCLEVAKDSGNLPQAFGNKEIGMTIRYPALYTVKEDYTYQVFGPGKNISGVKFTIPSSMATGTNLSTDSYISVEHATSSTACTAGIFLDPTYKGGSVTIVENGVTMSFASTTGAAAGNRYEESVYAFPGSSPCLAIRYFIHSGTIGNYPKEVKEFDKAALLKEFDAIRKTFIAVQ